MLTRSHAAIALVGVAAGAFGGALGAGAFRADAPATPALSPPPVASACPPPASTLAPCPETAETAAASPVTPATEVPPVTAPRPQARKAPGKHPLESRR